jgi:two-component system OmpR family response regulator/two-component system response regulator CpxR
MTAVLVFEEDVELARSLTERFRGEGFTIEWVGLPNLVSLAASGQFDCAVLGAGRDGSQIADVLSAVRRQSTLAVLVLIASDEEAERIVALELGADDCVVKPCSPREVVARVRAILRRSRRAPAHDLGGVGIVVAGPLTMWLQRREVEWDGHRLVLTSTEFDVLALLASKAGQPVSKQELSLHCLGRPLTRYDRSIDVHVSSIRQKLGPRPDGRAGIQTVRRRGYQLIGE